MTATLVPTVKTKYTVKEMIAGFVDGWFQQFNEIPKKESIGVLFAQWSLETAQGSSCWNANFGNVKCNPITADSTVKYCFLNSVWEVNKDGEKVYYQPPSVQCAFRAFDSLSDGMSFYLGFIKNGRYAAAWSAVESGNVAAFAHLLKLKGYYTAPEADYIAGMSYYYNSFMKDTTFESVASVLNKTVVAVDPTPVPAPTNPTEQSPTVQPVVVIPEYVPNTDTPESNPLLTLSFWQKMGSYIIDLINKFNKK